MHREPQEQVFGKRKENKGARNLGQMMYTKKFDSDFSREMTRSVQAMVRAWVED